MNSLNHLGNALGSTNELKRKKRLNMGDIKLFAKKEKGLETLMQTIRIFSQDIRMEFGIEKCAMQIMRSEKRQMTEGIEQPNKKS